MLHSKIFIRNLRRATKPVINKNLREEPIAYDNNNLFKVIENEIDLKKCENLSTIARLAIENNADLIKSVNNGKAILNENNKFTQKFFDLNENYKNFRNNLLNEINDLNEDHLKLKPEKLIKNLLNDSDYNDLTEDANIRASSVQCGGCGSNFQCNDKTKAGFLSADLFKKFKKSELYYKLCVRCELLKYKQKKYLNLTANIDDYEKNVMSKIVNSEKKNLVILLIDLLDLPNSIYAGWSKLFDRSVNADVVIIGSKLDLLPNTGPTWQDDIKKCLLSQCADKGIKGEQIKHVELISAQNGYKIEKLISRLFRIFQYEGDVYLLGVTNAGKSVLFNRLLSSDFCESLASDALNRATTSYWPNTTMNMLKFPITKLNEKKYKLRKERLYEDFLMEKNKYKEAYERFKKTHTIEDAELFGIVNKSFKSVLMKQNEVNSEFAASYSFDGDKINEGQNYKSEKDIKREEIESAREVYNPKKFSKNCFFYDTPGVLLNDHVLSKFSNSEVEISTPDKMMLPRVAWMVPGQSLFVGGVIRIDLLESTNSERVLFSLMTNMRLPIIEPFKTVEAEDKYEALYEANKLIVPYKKSSARPNGERLKLKSKDFTIKCIGNHMSTADIVFSCFGWTAVTSRPEITAKVRAYTIDDSYLQLREPSLLPYVVNMRRLYCHPHKKQIFVSRFTRVAYDIKPQKFTS